MNDDLRSQVRSTAKYLRNVRPVNPDEIFEYVDGSPHPGVVRQVLREEVFDLGLVERDDGTFVPVSEDPVSPSFYGVSEFPERYGRQLEELLIEEFGAGWADSDAGDRFREAIRRLKEDYYQQNPVAYDHVAAIGYAIYHLPDYYAAVQYVLDEIGEKELLPRKLRILDVGAGTGGPALGIHDFLPEDALVDYHAIEPSDSAGILERMLETTDSNFRTTVHRTTAEVFEPTGEYDIVLFANVYSELDDPVAVTERLLEYLAADGSLVAIEPADMNTSIGLREVEREFDDEYTIYSPTLRLWPGENPSDRGWSFDVQPDLAVPPFQKQLDDGSGEFVNVTVQYSHFILRQDGAVRLPFTPSSEQAAKMADSDDHVTQRINLVGVKLSHDLGDGGHPLFKISDGSERVSHFAVLTSETALNADLKTAEYGDILLLEQALVLWNDDEEAYNLVVDDETVVDRVPA